MTDPLPIAIILPHAGYRIPPELSGRVALTEAQVFNEADAYADQLFDFRDRVRHWLCFPYARAVIDVNRLPDVAANRQGDGIVKRRTSYGAPVYLPGQEPDAALEQALVARYWRPWHQQLAAVAADEQVRLVIDAHTMAAMGPSQYDDPAQARPRLMLGNWGDANGEQRPGFASPTAPASLMRQWAETMEPLFTDFPLLVESGAVVALNHPFYGGADLRLHGGRWQPWIMMEISRALYVGAQDGDTPIVAPDPWRIAEIRARLWRGISALARDFEEVGFLA